VNHVLAQILSSGVNAFAISAMAVWALIALVAVLLYVMGWFFAIVEVVRREDMESAVRVVWILLLIFLPFFGTIIYFVIGRQR
jgi:hypothetical protein